MSRSEDTEIQQLQLRLFAALADFVKPIIYECMSSETTLEELKQISTSPAKSLEHQLIQCLKAFIAETFDSCRTVVPDSYQRPNDKITGIADRPITGPGILKSSYMIQSNKSLYITLPKLEQFFERDILTRVRIAISTFPTRLLAFDSTGSSIELLDHRGAAVFLANTLLAYVLNDSPHFLQDLIQLYGKDSMENIQDVSDRGHAAKRMAAQLNRLIEKHARYTILSHTWTKTSSGEISYQDWPTRSSNSAGYAKISNFCKASAESYGCRLGWVDTCCINKESSAELDEAIRSMYKWYSGAALCVVYLSETKSLDTMPLDSWFTRGWTLQELVAPKKIEVYDMYWKKIICNENTVANVAGIRPSEIRQFRTKSQDRIPISRRLQMACGRHVTREEDSAYSLMGLLGVSISTAYGEGAQSAFSRLMRELTNAKRHFMDLFNHDYSVVSNGVFPSTVEVYRNRSTAFDMPWSTISSKLNEITPVEPFLLTHLGLRMNLLIVPGISMGSFEVPPSPKGELYGRAWGLYLLHKSLYFKDYDYRYERTIFFGVVNFSLEDGILTITNPCLSIPLDCRKQKPGYIRQADGITIHHADGKKQPPPVFNLQYSKNPEEKYIKLPEYELELHGLQRITLYV